MTESNQRKLGVRPETHKVFGQISDDTGVSVRRLVDDALALLIKDRNLNIEFDARGGKSDRGQQPSAA